MRSLVIALSGVLCFLSTNLTVAATCGPEALGTSRTLSIDPAKHTLINGTESGLGLEQGEVILTFDDGPLPGRTEAILDALKDQCVQATFFAVGTMAKAYPRIARRVVREGHTVAHHTHAHDRLTNFSLKKAAHLIQRGKEMVEKAAYPVGEIEQIPYFRYPYLARSKATDRLVQRAGMVALGANIDSLDWKSNTPDVVHDRIMRRLNKAGKGIILMHDIQSRTAKMLPRLLNSLKRGGYRVVHLVAPEGYQPPARTTDEPMLVAKAEPKKTTAPTGDILADVDDSDGEAIIAAALADAGLSAPLATRKPQPAGAAAITPKRQARSRPTRKKRRLKELAAVQVRWKLRSSQWIIR